MIRIFVVMTFIILQSVVLQAQTKTIKEKSLITGRNVNVTIQGNYRENSKVQTRKKYTQLYKRLEKDKKEGIKMMLGNKCAEEVMHNYHFEYVLVPKNQGVSGSRYFFNNFFSNAKLFFKNGPFWKSRMRKKIEECRINSGDVVD